MIVGWNLSDTLDTGSVIQAVKDAVAEHGTPGILNSDPGFQFISREHRKGPQDFHITQSIDGKSHRTDNITIELWSRSLKAEEIDVNGFPSLKCLRKVIAAYTTSTTLFVHTRP